MIESQLKQINGPARCWNRDEISKQGAPEFLIHFLVEGVPVCKFIPKNELILVTAPISEIADRKKCPKCFAPIKNA